MASSGAAQSMGADDVRCPPRAPEKAKAHAAAAQLGVSSAGIFLWSSI